MNDVGALTQLLARWEEGDRDTDTAQRTFLELLGSAPNKKRHARLEGGHIPSDRQELIGEVGRWLDRHLGVVN